MNFNKMQIIKIIKVLWMLCVPLLRVQQNGIRFFRMLNLVLKLKLLSYIQKHAGLRPRGIQKSWCRDLGLS